MKTRKIEFRFWDNKLNKMHERKPLAYDFEHKEIAPLQFTGFLDKFGKEIFECDILGDWTETETGKIQSKNQVFWNQPTGSWHLDNSVDQDKTSSIDLWLELNDFEYEILGNIHQTK